MTGTLVLPKIGLKKITPVILQPTNKNIYQLFKSFNKPCHP